MWGIYWVKMLEYVMLNYFEYKVFLFDWYWIGDMKMKCLYIVVNQLLDYVYVYYIQCFMVIGNFVFFFGVDFDEFDQWYFGIYMDVIEWVEIINICGMSQFVDGGIVGIKFYVFSVNYMYKMSDYCINCVYDWKKKVGKDVCFFNSFYWDFYDCYIDKLGNNLCIGMMYCIWNKMDSEQ